MIKAQYQYDVPFDKLESSLMRWAEEAQDLAFGEGGDPDGRMDLLNLDWEDPKAIQQMLLRARLRSDRVAGLLAKATSAKHRAGRAQAKAAFEASLAYDTATDTNAQTRTMEFSTRDERKAAANLESIEQQRVAHFSERTTDIATEVHTIVNQMHWHLNGVRKDLRAAIEEIQFEASLER
jgi:predicted S18 family serine protease